MLKQPELNSQIQRKALSEMISEIENIHTAWGWMVDSDRWELIEKVKDPLLIYHIILGNYVQGREFFHLALQKLNKLNNPKLDLIRASMQQFSAWMMFRNGFITESLQGLTECLEIFRAYNSSWDIAMTLFYFAEANRILGNLPQAKDLIEDALNLMHGDNIPKSNYHTAITAHCQSLLGTILMGLGDFEQAQMYLNDSLSTHNRIGTYYGTIHPLMGLGWLAYLQENFLQARDLYLQALGTANDINDQRDMVLIHNRLGAIYELIANTSESYRHVLSAVKLCQETGDHRLTAITLNNLACQQMRYLHQPAEAIWTYHKCLEIFSSIGDLRGITFSSYDICRAYLKVGLLDEARNYCLQSLNTARTLDSTPLILHALHGFANLFAHTHESERALRLCYFIVNHPQIEPDTQKRAIVSSVELETVLPPETIQSARIWGKTMHLQDVINQIMAEKSVSLNI